jgi:transcriptional regulator with XRE-family HTH domain
MEILDGKALVEARKKKRWTQVELSGATKIDVSTVSRIERGKPTRVRQNTLKELTKALGVAPESLCPRAEAERDAMKLRIPSRARNALTLVALRYKIRREHVVEIAPLLFFIAAERSLIERQKRVDEVSTSADALLDLQGSIRHLPVSSPVHYEALFGEKKSIKARDLFGEMALEDAGVIAAGFEYDEAEDNPFVTYLRDSLAKVGSSPEVAKSVSWLPGFGPSYEICTEEASSIVGGDAEAAQAIVSGGGRGGDETTARI